MNELEKEIRKRLINSSELPEEIKEILIKKMDSAQGIFHTLNKSYKDNFYKERVGQDPQIRGYRFIPFKIRTNSNISEIKWKDERVISYKDITERDYVLFSFCEHIYNKYMDGENGIKNLFELISSGEINSISKRDINKNSENYLKLFSEVKKNHRNIIALKARDSAYDISFEKTYEGLKIIAFIFTAFCLSTNYEKELIKKLIKKQLPEQFDNIMSIFLKFNKDFIETTKFHELETCFLIKSKKSNPIFSQFITLEEWNLSELLSQFIEIQNEIPEEREFDLRKIIKISRNNPGLDVKWIKMQVTYNKTLIIPTFRINFVKNREEIANFIYAINSLNIIEGSPMLADKSIIESNNIYFMDDSLDEKLIVSRKISIEIMGIIKDFGIPVQNLPLDIESWIIPNYELVLKRWECFSKNINKKTKKDFIINLVRDYQNT